TRRRPPGAPRQPAQDGRGASTTGGRGSLPGRRGGNALRHARESRRTGIGTEFSSETSQLAGSQQLRQPSKRDPYPVGTIVQLVVELVERLVDEEEVEQARALHRVERDQRVHPVDAEVAAQERRTDPALPH